MSLAGKWRSDDNGEVSWSNNEDYADDEYDREEQEKLDDTE